MKNLSKPTAVVAKIIEIVHWLCVAIMIFVVIFAGLLPIHFNEIFHGLLNSVSGMLVDSIESGLDEVIPDDFGAWSFPDDFGAGSFQNPTVTVYRAVSAVRVVSLAGAAIAAIWAIVFRNIYKIAKNTLNLELSYFCPDNIKRVQRIGYLAIAAPIFSLVISIIGGAFVRGAGIVVSLDLGGFVIGLVVLFVTQFLVRGAELEKEVEGLV